MRAEWAVASKKLSKITKQCPFMPQKCVENVPFSEIVCSNTSNTLF